MNGFCLIGFAPLVFAWLVWFFNITRPLTNEELGMEVLKSFYEKGMYTEARNRELEKAHGWKRPGVKPPVSAAPRREDYLDYEAYEKARHQWEYDQPAP